MVEYKNANTLKLRNKIRKLGNFGVVKMILDYVELEENF
jgi:hypothetical protein